MSEPSILPRIGLVAADPLRILGTQNLLEDGVRFTVVPLGAPRASELADVELVVIDATATDHLFALIAAFRRMRPQIRLIVVGTESEMSFTEQVIGAGARGYVRHAAASAELQGAVDAVRDGSVWAPRKVLARLLERAQHGVAPSAGTEVARTTRREQAVLSLLLEGKSNREIASELQIEEGTVKTHLSRLMRKAGVTNRTALTMRALESGSVSQIGTKADE